MRHPITHSRDGQVFMVHADHSATFADHRTALADLAATLTRPIPTPGV